MSLEVLLCAIAALLLLGGVFAAPFLLIRNRTGDRRIAKYVLQAMIVAVPWVLFFPVAYGYHCAARSLGDLVFHYTRSVIAQEPVFQFLRKQGLTGDSITAIVNCYRDWAIPYIFIAPATLVGLVRQRVCSTL